MYPAESCVSSGGNDRDDIGRWLQPLVAIRLAGRGADGYQTFGEGRGEEFGHMLDDEGWADDPQEPGEKMLDGTRSPPVELDQDDLVDGA